MLLYANICCGEYHIEKAFLLDFSAKRAFLRRQFSPFLPFQAMVFTANFAFRTHNAQWHSIIKTRKIFSKNLQFSLAENEKASTFAPAFERERVLRNGLGEIRETG